MSALTGMNSGPDERRQGMDGWPGSASMAAMSLAVISAWMSRRCAVFCCAGMMSVLRS